MVSRPSFSGTCKYEILSLKVFSRRISNSIAQKGMLIYILYMRLLDYRKQSICNCFNLKVMLVILLLECNLNLITQNYDIWQKVNVVIKRGKNYTRIKTRIIKWWVFYNILKHIFFTNIVKEFKEEKNTCALAVNRTALHWNVVSLSQRVSFYWKTL